MSSDHELNINGTLILLAIMVLFLCDPCHAGVERTVLLEYFTDATHPDSFTMDMVVDVLLGEYTRFDMISICYHVDLLSGDPFSTIYGSWRKAYYGVTVDPETYIDGRRCVGACDHRAEINADITAGSPVLLTMSGRLDTDEGFVIVEAEAVDPITVPDLHIRLAVCEDPIYYYTRDLRYVLRTMGLEEAIFISSVGDRARTARNFVIDPSWDTAALSVVAFVQSDVTNEVLQAGFYDGSPAVSVTPIPITNTWSSGTLPAIDGTFSPGEWDDAEETFVDLSYYVNFPFYSYSMNDDTWLYLCIDAVGDTVVGGIHSGGIFFDTDEDGLLTVDEEAGVETFFAGDCAFQVWDGTGFSLVTSSGSGIPFTPGLHDEAGMIGASGYGRSDRSADPHYIYEFKIPLALGELNALPGDVLRPYMYLYGASEISYWSPHTKWEDPLTYGHMTLADSSSGVPIATTFFMVLVSLGLSFQFLKISIGGRL